MPIAAAVFCIVHEANEWFAIDEDVVATGVCLIGVGPTTSGVYARIAFAHGVETVDKDVV